MNRVLVFDSGVGGLSVADAIAAARLEVEIDYLADNAWLPYGLKSEAELAARVPTLVGAVAREVGAEAVILACNTASVAALAPTRAALSIPVVGVVPPIKPAAAATKTGVIGLLATPSTVRSPYVERLITEFAEGVRVVRYGAPALVAAAEAKLRGEAPARAAIDDTITGLFEASGGDAIDVVALACTHFPLLSSELAEAAPRSALWLDSGAAIARRLAHVLALEAGHGQTRFSRAAFTDAHAGASLAPAMCARGFTTVSEITPALALAPLARA